MRFRLPPHAPGMRIGLFGGSFNPTHSGHLLVSDLALKRLRLDRIWWLVSPGNPLKDNYSLASVEQRLKQTQACVRDPRIIVTDLELRLGKRFTADTLFFLKQNCPKVHFIWIMGADNLIQFHLWQNWERIVNLMPVAVFDRPGSTFKISSAKMAQRFNYARRPEISSYNLVENLPPAFTIIHGPRSNKSSTAVRAKLNYIK